MTILRVKSRQWIVDENDKIIIGEGRSQILETIEKTGSLNKTAKIMKMSYKAVWGKIRATEEHLGSKVVVADRKLGTRLTEEGKRLLEKYRLFKKMCLQEEERIFQAIFSELN